MIKILIKRFVKNHEHTESHDVREAYGVLAGTVGIVCNVFLFALKLTIGLILGSIAIMSDAFNNLSDIGSSLVAVAGAKLSNRAADSEHPFGHGRYEYIASLMISFIIMLVGIELFKASFDKIISPMPIEINGILMGILIASILVKVWMFSYNRYIAKVIDSGVNRATARDSLNDIFATSAVIFATMVSPMTALPVDGIAGIAVSCLIFYTGFEVAKDTVDVLLGMSPSDETVASIMSILTANSAIVDAHDLKVHDYGPGRKIASVHTEILEHTDLIKAHAIVDGLEKRIFRELGIDIVIHVDPIAAGQVGPVE